MFLTRRNLRNTWAFTLLVLSVMWSPTYAEETNAELVLTTLANAQKATTTISGTLVQRTLRRDDPTDTPRVLNGTYAISLPNSYDVVFTKPDDEEWRQRVCGDGEHHWRIEETFAGQPPAIHRDPGVDEDMARLLSCLRFDLAALRKDFTLSATTLPTGAVQVTLLPQAQNTALTQRLEQITAEFDAAHRVKRVVIDDPQGNRYEVTLITAQYGLALPISRFRGPTSP